MKALNLNQDNFNLALESSTQPVLVDFWADWCGPCKMLAPVIDQLATEWEGRAVISKVNVDESPELASRYGITGIPTLIVFRNGQPVKTLRGVQPKSALNAALSLSA